MREAAKHGQLLVTDNGRAIARIVPESAEREVPYFARRQFADSRVQKLIESGQLGRNGSDVTQLISEEREDRA